MVDYGQLSMEEFEEVMSREEENELLRELTKEFLRALYETRERYELYRTMNDYACTTSEEEEKKIMKKHRKATRQLKARLNFLLYEVEDYDFSLNL